MESSAQAPGDRMIPIEIIREVYGKSSDSASMDPVQNLASNPGAGDSEGDMSGSNSNRTSLIITFEDGTTEEDTALVTNLGLSPERIKKRGSQVSIVELEQDTPIRNLSHGYIPNNRMVIEEELPEQEIALREVKVIHEEREVTPEIKMDIQSHITKVELEVIELKPKDDEVQEKEINVQPSRMTVETKVIKIDPEHGELSEKGRDVKTKIIKVPSKKVKLEPNVIETTLEVVELPEEIMDIHPKVTKLQPQVMEIPQQVMEKQVMQPDMKEGQEKIMSIQPNITEVHSQVMETQFEVVEIPNTFIETSPNILEMPPKVIEMTPKLIEVRPNVREITQKVMQISSEGKDTPSSSEETLAGIAEVNNNINNDEPDVINLGIGEIEIEDEMTEVEHNETEIQGQDKDTQHKGRDIPSSNMAETSPNGSPSDISWATARESSCQNSPISSSPPEFSVLAANTLSPHKDDIIGIEHHCTTGVENKEDYEVKHDTSQLCPVDVDEEMGKIEIKEKPFLNPSKNIMDEFQKHLIQESQRKDDQTNKDKALEEVHVRQDKQTIVRKNSIKHIKVILPTQKDVEMKADESNKRQKKPELPVPNKPLYTLSIPDNPGTEQSPQPNGSQSNSCQSEALSVVSHLVPSHSQQEAVNVQSPRPKTQHDKWQTEQTEEDPVEKQNSDKKMDTPVPDTDSKSSYSQEMCTSKKESLTENSKFSQSIEQTNIFEKVSSEGNNKITKSHLKESKSKQEFCNNNKKQDELSVDNELKANQTPITKDTQCFPSNSSISISEESSSSTHQKSSTSEQKSLIVQRQSSISENTQKQDLFSSEHQSFSKQHQKSMTDQLVENLPSEFKAQIDDHETPKSLPNQNKEFHFSQTETLQSHNQHSKIEEILKIPPETRKSFEEKSSNYKQLQSSSSEETLFITQQKLSTSDKKSFTTFQKCSSSEEKSFTKQQQSKVSDNESFMTQEQLFSSSSHNRTGSSEKNSPAIQRSSSNSEQELVHKEHSSQKQSSLIQPPTSTFTSSQSQSFTSSSQSSPKEKIPTSQQELRDLKINNQTQQMAVYSSVSQPASLQETQIPCSVDHATYVKTETPPLNHPSLGTNEVSFPSQDKKLISNKQYPSVNTDSRIQKTSLSEEKVMSSQSQSSSIQKASSFIIPESNRQEANFGETLPVKKVSRLVSDEPTEINVNSPTQVPETVDFPAIITASATIHKDAPVSINMTTTFSPASPTLNSPRSPTGLIEIPIQREKMITAPTKPPSSQPRIIPIEIQRDTVKQSQPSNQDQKPQQHHTVKQSQPPQRNIVNQNDFFSHSQLAQMEPEPHFQSLPSSFNSSEQLPRTYARSLSTGQKEIHPDSVENADQVRIIPISLSDGRIIENSGSETQEINMEFTEMSRKEFSDGNKTRDTITKNEDTSKEQGSAKTKHTNAPTKDNQTDRLIPIQLETGQTLTPVFTKLEDPEPPEWSAFHRTGNEKERIIPITIITNQPAGKQNQGSSETITNQPVGKHPQGLSKSAKIKQTAIKSPQTEQSTTESMSSHGEDEKDQVMQHQKLKSGMNNQHKDQSIQGKLNVGASNTFLETEERKTPPIIGSSKQHPNLTKMSVDLSRPHPESAKLISDLSKPPLSLSKPPAIQRQTSEKLSRQHIENVESSKSIQRAARTTLSETRSLDEQFVTGRKTNHPAKTNAQIDDGDQARSSNNSTVGTNKSSTLRSGETINQTEGGDSKTAEKNRGQIGGRDNKTTGVDQDGVRDSTAARRLTTIRSQSVDTHPKKKSERDRRMGSYNMKRERSLQDINKDIDTIWKELQKLDSLPSSRSRLDRTGDDRSSREMSTPPPPLSEITLVRPSWKSESPSSNPAHIRGRSTQVKPKEPIGIVRTTIWDLPPQGQPRTIWDPPESPSNQNPSKYPSTPVPIPRQGRSPEAIARSFDNKPQFNPVTTQHFSFLPKASPTRPGAITPTYVNSSPRSQVRSENLSPQAASSPKVGVRRENMTPLAASTPRNGIRSDDMSHTDQQQGVRVVPINNTGPQQFNGENSRQKVKNLSESQPNLKSCLKTDVRNQGASNGVCTFGRTRSESPAARASPHKQNVNFKQETLVKVYNRNDSTTTAPNIPSQSNSKYGISVTNSNYGMVNFQKTEGGTTQGKIVSDNQDFEIIQKDEVFEAKEWNKKYQSLKQTNGTSKTMQASNGEMNKQKSVPIIQEAKSMTVPTATTSSSHTRNSVSTSVGTSPSCGVRNTFSPTFGARKQEANSSTLGTPVKEGTVKVIQLETEKHQVPIIQVRQKKKVPIVQDDTRTVQIMQDRDRDTGLIQHDMVKEENNPFLKNEEEEPNSTRFPHKEMSPVCDASTQTEIPETTDKVDKTDKKGGCVMM